MSPSIDWAGLDLRLREPAAEPAGALILNHGRGADENDLFPLLDELDPERRLLGVTTGAPWVGIPPGGRHWYVVPRVGYPERETFDRSLTTLGGRVDDLLSDRGIGWGQAVLGGFSQGTVMSYALGLGAGRPAPAGILATSGFVPDVEGWQPDLGARAGATRILLHHGAQDPVIEVAFGRRDRDAFEAAGIDLAYRETEAGHWLPPELIGEMRGFVGSALGGAGDERPA